MPAWPAICNAMLAVETLILVLTCFISVATAEANFIQAIELEVPREIPMIPKKCATALEAALADKQAYEDQHNVNCMRTLDFKTMKVLEEAFLLNCESTVSAHANSVSSGRVSIDVETVRAMFNLRYSPVFQTSCMDREIARFNLDSERTRQQAVERPTTHSPRISEIYR